MIHTADIVDEFNEAVSLENASREVEKLEDAGLPYGVLGGNHDVAHGNENYELYNKYFGAFRYEGNPWYGGTYEDNKGHYDLVQVDGEKLLLIYMSWDIYTPEVEWINSVLEQYPGPEGHSLHPPRASMPKRCPITSATLLVEQVCRDHPNVIAMLNGHYHGASLNFVGFDDDGDGVEERVVYRICTDYQSAPGGGQGVYQNDILRTWPMTKYISIPTLPFWMTSTTTTPPSWIAMALAQWLRTWTLQSCR